MENKKVLTIILLTMAIVMTSSTCYAESGQVSQDKNIKNLFKDKINFSKEYILVKNNQGTESIKMVYVPDKNAYLNINTNKEKGISKDYSIDTDKQLLFNNLNNFKVWSGKDEVINENKARDIMYKYITNLYGQDYEIHFVKEENFNGNNCWFGYVRKRNISVYYSDMKGNIVIDKRTGRLVYIDMNFGYYYGCCKNEISYKEGYNKSLGILKAYFWDKLGDIETKQDYTNDFKDKKYLFEFFMKKDDAIYKGNNISVKFDSYSGKIKSLSFKWNDDLRLPCSSNLISKDKVREIYINNCDIEKMDKQMEIYELKNNLYYIDAITGELIK